jgi:molybdopterin converting factor small subunit
MSVLIYLHKSHRQYTNGLKTVDVEGRTVGACLDNLVQQFPDLKKELFDKKGKLKNIIEIYLNMTSAFPDELAKPTKAGDEIHITLLLAGG